MVTMTPEMREQLQKEMAQKAFLASVTKLFTNTTFGTNWQVVVGIFGFSNEASDTSRFYKDHYFHNDSYPNSLMSFLESAFATSQERSISMIKYVIEELKNEGVLKDSDIECYPALRNLEKMNIPDLQLMIPKIETIKFLEIDQLPDDFYNDLLAMVNQAFSYELYVAVQLMTRKMLENLLVDVLRKKYGMGAGSIELFYDTRFHGAKDFRTLITNFGTKLTDFQMIIPSLDSNFVRTLHSFREQGNGAAHTLEIHVTRKKLLDNKASLELVIKTLVRLFNNC